MGAAAVECEASSARGGEAGDCSRVSAPARSLLERRRFVVVVANGGRDRQRCGCTFPRGSRRFARLQPRYGLEQRALRDVIELEAAAARTQPQGTVCVQREDARRAGGR
eukprot:6034343-Prymnesium_polylepis.1